MNYLFLNCVLGKNKRNENEKVEFLTCDFILPWSLNQCAMLDL